MFSQIADVILKSNTFNFIVFSILIALILKKIDFSALVEKLRKKAEDEVNSSSKAKKDSQTALINAEKKIEKADKDVEKIIEDSESTAAVMASNIISGANGPIEIIRNNAQKVITNDIYKTRKKLSDFTIKESIKLAEENIKDKLKNDETLHQKYIDEAINELEGINL